MTLGNIAGSTIALIAFGLCVSAARAGEPMTLTARLARPVMASEAAQTNYLRIGLNGCEPQHSANRTPVNVAFVIDRSGSMQGDRIAQARAAAIMAVKRLGHDDIASVVIFDDQVDVPVPAQTVADRNYFIDRIERVGVRGNTAIYAGVTQGAREVRKFKDPHRLNRIVLLSDGEANVGPTQPAEFAALGRQLLAEGISVSTIGLGADYNEDLMLQLARAADGNHAFSRAPTDLVQIFDREFNDVLTSCAQMVSIDVELKAGVNAVRAISRDGKIEGGRAQFQLGQVYAATEHYVLMEIAFANAPPAGEQEIGVVHVSHVAPDGDAKQTIDGPIRARFGASTDEVAANVDHAVMESVIEQEVRARTARAVQLRDQGRAEEALALLGENTREINAFLAKNKSVSLSGLLGDYTTTVGSLLSADSWGVQRKVLRGLDMKGPNAAGARY